MLKLTLSKQIILYIPNDATSLMKMFDLHLDLICFDLPKYCIELLKVLSPRFLFQNV